MEVNKTTVCADVLPESRPNTLLFLVLCFVFMKITSFNVKFDQGVGFYTYIVYALYIIDLIELILYPTSNMTELRLFLYH